MSFPGGSVVMNLPTDGGDARDMGLIPGSGKFSGKGNGNPLQYSFLGNPTESDTTEQLHTHAWRLYDAFLDPSGALN